MSSVKSAIILSDLHLGRESSYLHSNHFQFKHNKKELMAVLKKLGPVDELIINGDFLELSLSGLTSVYRDVREFFLILAEAGPYQRLVYIPGNHDHHFWRTLAEQIIINGRISMKRDPPAYGEYPFYFVDRRYSSSDHPSYTFLLPELWPEDRYMPEIVVKYPHHLLRVKDAGKVKNVYLITHGHFLEDLFKPVNYIIDPTHIEELEAFNNFWLETFDYHLGHAGRLSKKVIELVESYEKGEKRAKKKIKEVAGSVYDNLNSKIHFKWPLTWIIKFAIKILIPKIKIDRQSALFNVALDDDLKERVSLYIKKYIIHRYRKGKVEKLMLPSSSNIPVPFTFVFGHTHRPILRLGGEYEKVKVSGKEYPLANSGGWLRTDGTGRGDGENAGMLVVDSSGIRWESMSGRLK